MSYFRSLTQTACSVLIITLVIFSINSIFLPAVFAESVESTNSSEQIEVLDLVLIEKLQNNFINELSNYDHVTISQLSDTEVQVLLSDNYQSLSYSLSEQDWFSITRISCAMGIVSFAMSFALGVGFFKARISSDRMQQQFLVISGLGCVAGALIGNVFIGLASIISHLASS